jgi:hypothetical protein
MSKTRAYGADCALLAAFETAYGTMPASGCNAFCAAPVMPAPRP